MWELILRIILAGVIGFIVGINTRNAYKNIAGRLFCIISMAACLLTITSLEFFKLLELPWVSDPGRISAQVVSALGFLGTGLIWVSEGQNVRGLSVGASLWFTAILGVVVGAGLNKIGFIGLVFILFIYYASKPIANWKNQINKKS